MATIAIIGSGTVGLATGRGFIEKGHRVKFYDTDPRVAERLRQEGFRADVSIGSEKDFPDFVFLTVSTPTEGGRIRLQSLESAARNVGGLLEQSGSRKYPVIVVKSTVPPRTTERVVLPLLEDYSGKMVGKDFGLAMNPEYLRERYALEDVRHPRLIVIGAVDDRSGRLLEALYTDFAAPVAQIRPEEAELQKYVHNLLNATKISFFNEMRLVSDQLGYDADKIFQLTVTSAEAMWNPSYGTHDQGPFGGKCLPKDTRGFLSWVRREMDMPLPLLRSVIRVNDTLFRANRKASHVPINRQEEARVLKGSHTEG